MHERILQRWVSQVSRFWVVAHVTFVPQQVGTLASGAQCRLAAQDCSALNLCAMMSEQFTLNICAMLSEQFTLEAPRTLALRACTLDVCGVCIM